MKKTKIIYWMLTSLFALLMFASAIPDILSDPIAVKGMHEGLGYPVYFIPFIGFAKVLGALAIMTPVRPAIKEWAYAGLFFDLIGATYSIAASGQPVANWAFMALPIILAIGSYTFYHKKIKLGNNKSEQKYENILAGSVA